MDCITLTLFPALPGSDHSLQAVQPEALRVGVSFYGPAVRIEEEDQKVYSSKHLAFQAGL